MTETNHVKTIGNIQLSHNQLNKLQKLVNININQKLTARDKLQTSLELLLDQIAASQGSIILLDEKHQCYRIVASSQKEIVNSQKNVNPKSIIGHVCKNHKPIFIKDLNKDRHSRPSDKKYNYQSVIAYPIISDEDQLLGIFNATNYVGDNSFNESDFKLAATFVLILTPIVEKYINSRELCSDTAENKDILSEILTGKNNRTYSSDIKKVQEYYQEQEEQPQAETLSDILTETSYFHKTKNGGRKIKKKKSTYYLDNDLIEFLENAKKQIKKQVPGHMKSDVTKSKIINFALDTILRDYYQQKEKSLLMQGLLSKDK